MKYLILLLFLTGCDDSKSCFDKNRQWNYFDYCYNIPGTPQYIRARPAPCPWPKNKKDQCCPPRGC